jgi:chromosome segregation ATPase
MATKEQIWQAATELAEEGVKPTLLAVRERLGGGSYTDISAAMQLWRANRDRAATPLREPAPAAVTERLGDVAAELWAVALEFANARLASEREALELARQETEQTRQEAADLADQLAADLDQARADLTRAAEKVAINQALTNSLREQYDALKETSAAAVHRADMSEAARSELQGRVEHLAALLDREQAARAAAEDRAQASAGELAALRARLEAAERRAADSEARATGAEKEASQARREAEAARVAEQAGQARLESAARELDELKQAKREAEERARKAGEEAAELRGRLSSSALPQEKPKAAPRKPKTTTE